MTRAAAALPELLAEATRLHRAGRLDQAAALYRRIISADPRQADALHLLGLVHHARGEQEAALAAVDRAIGVRADVGAFYVSRGAVLMALRQPQDAAHAARRALALDPSNAEACNMLGNALMGLHEVDGAVAFYRQAIRFRPDYVEALNNLGSALRALDRPPDAEAALRKALRLRPAYASALANLGLVLQDRQRWAEALDCLDRAVAAQPSHATAHANRALLLLLLGRLGEGFAEYEWRWRAPGFATPARAFRQAPWDGGELAGRTLFVHAEQGLGSAIQFARFACAATGRGGPVILECQCPLERLFHQSLAAPAGPLAAVAVKGQALPEFDTHAPLMSLPHLLGIGLETVPADVPYLRADDDDRARWRSRLAETGRPRIGLTWAGNPGHENDRNRSMPAAALAPLIEATAASFFSLQVPARPADLAALPAGRVTDLAPELRDFAETAAVIANLDLVVSVDTAVAHLAGALARPVLLLLPHIPEWRWLLDRLDTPWYPTMRLFRQTVPGDWAGVVAQVAAAIQEGLAGPVGPVGQ